MSYYEEIFTRLSRAATLDEVISIRDQAAVARIKARLAGDLQTETLAADIVSRANQKSLTLDRHHKGARGRKMGSSWLPLHSLGTQRLQDIGKRNWTGR